MKNKLIALAGAAVLSLGTASVVAGVGQAQAAPIEGISAAQAAGYPVLRTGSTGDAVKVLQRFLGVKVDGQFGPATAKAVTDFQRSAGIGADGIVGPATWSRLVRELGPGARADKVKVLQATLNDEGAHLTVDGVYGPATQAAVRAYQQKKGLAADGIAGANTWRALLGGSSSGGSSSGGSTSGSQAGKLYVNPKAGGYTNGRLPDNVLCAVPFSPQHRVACYIVNDLNRMNTAYRAHFGTNIQIVGARSAYRTYAEQVAMKAERGDLAATPGYSNHGWGLAVDVDSPRGSDRYNWLNANAGRFGFDDVVSNEAWHWQYTR